MQCRLKTHQKLLGSLGSFLHLFSVQQILIYFKYHSQSFHKKTLLFPGATLLRYITHQRRIFKEMAPSEDRKQLTLTNCSGSLKALKKAVPSKTASHLISSQGNNLRSRLVPSTASAGEEK